MRNLMLISLIVFTQFGGVQAMKSSSSSSELSGQLPESLQSFQPTWRENLKLNGQSINTTLIKLHEFSVSPKTAVQNPIRPAATNWDNTDLPKRIYGGDLLTNKEVKSIFRKQLGLNFTSLVNDDLPFVNEKNEAVFKQGPACQCSRPCDKNGQLENLPESFLKLAENSGQRTGLGNLYGGFFYPGVVNIISGATILAYGKDQLDSCVGMIRIFCGANLILDSYVCKNPCSAQLAGLDMATTAAITASVVHGNTDYMRNNSIAPALFVFGSHLLGSLFNNPRKEVKPFDKTTLQRPSSRK